jgi:hypothetical protein
MSFEPISKGFETKTGLRPEQVKLPTEHLILNLEGVIVNLVYDVPSLRRNQLDPVLIHLREGFSVPSRYSTTVIVNEGF